MRVAMEPSRSDSGACLERNLKNLGGVDYWARGWNFPDWSASQEFCFNHAQGGLPDD
jgi:hypothetical protein